MAIDTLTIKTNYSCNRSCYYCLDYRANKQSSLLPDLTEIDKYLLLVLKKCQPKRITIMGGEPGLLSVEHWSALLEIINNYAVLSQQRVPLIICTNGTALKYLLSKSILGKYSNVIMYYLCHLAGNYYEYDLSALPRDPAIVYKLVVTPQNYIQLNQFIYRATAQQIKLQIVAGFNPDTYDTYLSEDQLISLSELPEKLHLENVCVSTYIEQYKMFMGYPGIYNTMKYCCNAMILSPLIDLITQTVKPCCSYTDKGLCLSDATSEAFIENLMACRVNSPCTACHVQHIQDVFKDNQVISDLPRISVQAQEETLKKAIMKLFFILR